VGDGCFLATGTALFPGSRLGRGVEVRINGVVDVNTVLDDGAMVPIGWVAVGNPARVIAPWDHDEIWRIQKALDFPKTVYGLPRDASARKRIEHRELGRLGELVDLREPVAHLGRVEHLVGRRLGMLAAVPEAELEPAAVGHAGHLQLAKAGEAPPQRVEQRARAVSQCRHVHRMHPEAG
jgi:hypothetical protein